MSGLLKVIALRVKRQYNLVRFTLFTKLLGCFSHRVPWGFNVGPESNLEIKDAIRATVNLLFASFFLLLSFFFLGGGWGYKYLLQYAIFIVNW